MLRSLLCTGYFPQCQSWLQFKIAAFKIVYNNCKNISAKNSTCALCFFTKVNKKNRTAEQNKQSCWIWSKRFRIPDNVFKNPLKSLLLENKSKKKTTKKKNKTKKNKQPKTTTTSTSNPLNSILAVFFQSWFLISWLYLIF